MWRKKQLKGLFWNFPSLTQNFKEWEKKEKNDHWYQTRGTSNTHVAAPCRGCRYLPNATLEDGFWSQMTPHMLLE